jgi:hypothetical protein
MNERGQAMVEYVVLTFSAMLLLFVPWPFFGDKSLFLYFIEVFDIYLRSFHTVLALPIP